MIYQMSGIPDMKYGRVSFRKLGGGGRRFFIWFGLAKDHNNIISTARCSSVPSCLRYIPSRPTCKFECSKLFYARPASTKLL